jgi:hypothetical protein
MLDLKRTEAGSKMALHPPSKLPPHLVQFLNPPMNFLMVDIKD